MTPGAIHASIDWQAWLRLFQLPSPTAALPARTTCPFCHNGTMVIYADVIGYGQWAACRNCHVAGNLLYLSGKLWRTNIEETVQRLRQHGIPVVSTRSTLPLYRAKYHRPARTASRFWQDAQQNLTKPEVDFRTKLSQLCRALPTSHNELRERLRDICGVAPYETVEQIYGGTASHNKLFRGANWADVLVVPRWRLPGQHSGFTFLGRGWQMTRDRVDCMFDADYGLATPPKLLQDPPNRGRRRVLATSRLGLYLKLQLRSAVAERRTVPLVHWSAKQTRLSTAWQALRGADIVLWEPNLSDAGIATAYQLNSPIATVSTDAILKSLQRPGGETPEELIDGVIERAQPWHEAASKLMRSLNDEKLLALLSAIGDRNVEISQLLAACSLDVQKRAAKLLGDAYDQRSVQLGRFVVVEREGAWYASPLGSTTYGAGTLLVNAILRIDRVVHRPRLNVTLYQGRVIYKGQEIPFCDERDTIERNTQEWLQQVLLRHNSGVLYANPSWRRYITQIAMQLHAPALVRGADHIGWDHTRGSLVLPQFEISSNGVARQHEGGFQADAPGYLLPAPDVMTSQDIEDLGAETTRRALIALVGCVAASVLAPLVRVTPPNLLLHGAGADELLVRLAQGCGLTSVRPARITDCTKHIDTQRVHAWPTAIDTTFCRTKAFIRWLTERSGFDGVITTVADDTQDALHLTEQWYVVDVAKAQRPPTAATASMAKLLTAYIAHMLQSQLLPGGDVDWVETVLDDLQLFVERVSPSTPIGALTGSGGLLRTRDAVQIARGFAQSLVRLRARGIASVDGDVRGGVKLIATPTTLEIPKTAYLAAVHSLWEVPLSAFSISAALTSAQAMVEDREASWVIDLPWFEAATRRTRRRPVAS